METRPLSAYNEPMAGIVDYPHRSKPGEPVWELATLYPVQGR